MIKTWTNAAVRIVLFLLGVDKAFSVTKPTKYGNYKKVFMLLCDVQVRHFEINQGI